jgi:hypothetical protein
MAIRPKLLDPPAETPRWDGAHGTYLTGRAYLDGAEALQIEMEKKWGADRLRLLVTPELREKFDRQRYLFRLAAEKGSLEDVRRESARMITALKALDGAATAASKGPLDAEVMEIALPDGTVLAIVGDNDDARRPLNRRNGRRMVIYTLDEIAVLVQAAPALFRAKEILPGATVMKIRRHVTDPLDNIGSPGSFDDPVDDLWRRDQTYGEG